MTEALSRLANARRIGSSSSKAYRSIREHRVPAARERMATLLSGPPG